MATKRKSLARRVLDTLGTIVRRKPVSDLSYEVQTPKEARHAKDVAADGERTASEKKKNKKKKAAARKGRRR